MANPDVVGAAREQGEQARRLNAEQTSANRPDQYNPWGSTRWQQSSVVNPATGLPEARWTQTESLAEPLQQSLDSQMRISAGRAGMAEGSMARAWGDYQNPMDFDQFGAVQQFNYDPTQQRQAAEDAAYKRQTSRLDPQMESQERALTTRLNNQGLAPGDQAYDSAMQSFGRTRNDAYEQARLGSTAEGRSEADLGFGQAAQQNQIANALRTQSIGEGLGKRNFNLTESERLLQGQLIGGGPPSSGGQTQTQGGATGKAPGFNMNFGGE
jgi:hypothetical protein